MWTENAEMKDDVVAQKFLELFDGSGRESVFLCEVKKVGGPLCGEERVGVVD